MASMGALLVGIRGASPANPPRGVASARRRAGVAGGGVIEGAAGRGGSRRLPRGSEQPAGGELGADLEPLLLRQPPREVAAVHVAVGLARGDGEGDDRLLGVGELRPRRR